MENIKITNTDNTTEIKLPTCCEYCSNKPKPGETKFCNCALPALSQTTTGGDYYNY